LIGSHLERLEDRLLLTCPAEPITLTGTTGNDNILVESFGGSPIDVQFSVNGVTGGPCRPTQPIVINGLAGNDTITVRPDVFSATRIDGGPGSDTVSAGSGDDFIVARDGEADVVDSGLGIDRATRESPDRVSGIVIENPIELAPDNQTQRVKILALNYDPIIPTEGNRPLHEVFDWGNPAALGMEYLTDFNRVSGGAIQFDIVDWRNIGDFPPQRDGSGQSFRYTPAEYVQNRRTDSGWRQDARLDYYAMFDEQGVASLIDSGAVDEIWMFGDHFFLGWETAMAGPRSFFINGYEQPNISTLRPFVVTSIGYHVSHTFNAHNTGHRTEATMNRIYDGWNLANPTSNWDKFSANVLESNGKAGVGTTHVPANAAHHYDYENARVVQAQADDFLDYPNLTGATTPISRDSWALPATNDTHRDYQNWYFGHFPRAAGVNADGKQNNWWKYLFDFDNYDENGQPLPPRIWGEANDVLNTGGTTYEFTVAFSTPVPIDVATFDGNDVIVTGPNGFSQAATFVGVNDTSNGTYRVATYSITPPDGVWDAADRGFYSVTLQPNQVTTTQGAGMPAGIVAQFNVRGAAAVELPADADTTFLLRTDGNLTGASGEAPLASSGISFVPGRLGQAVHFGTPGSVSYANAGNISPAAGTVEFWIKPDWNADGTDHRFFEVGEGENLILFAIDGFNNLRFLANGDDPTTPQVETQLERGIAFNANDWVAGQWHHLAGTWDGATRQMALYVDGKPRGSIANGVQIADFSRTSFFIGASAGGFQPAQAAFDEFRISSRARSAGEILADFNAGIGYTSIAISPTNANVKRGANQQFKAIATDSTGLPRDVSSQVAWMTSDPAVTINSHGRLYSATATTATVTAQLDSLTANTPVTVEGAQTPLRGVNSLSGVTAFGGTIFQHILTFEANVDTSSIGLGDIRVHGPNGFTAFPTLERVIPNVGGSGFVRVHYTFTPPGGFWDPSDNGTYELYVLGNQLQDTSNNFVLATPSDRPVRVPVVNITPPQPPATHFEIAAPAEVTAGTPFDVTVTALDAFDQPVSSYGCCVTFTATGSASLPHLPGQFAFLINGSNTFQVTLNTAGDQSLRVTDMDNTSITTASIIRVIPAAAAHVAFATQPNSAQIGVAIAPAVTVRVLDPFDNLVTDATNAVSLAIASNPGSGMLGGTTSVAAAGGIATFSNLSVDQAGTGYTLAASADGLTGVESNPFNITTDPVPLATHFALSVPSFVNAGTSFNVTVTALDSMNQPTSGYAGLVHFSTMSGGTLPGDSTLVNGVGTFSVTLTTAGVQKIAVSDTSGGVTGDMKELGVRAASPVQLEFVTQPIDTQAGFTITPAITVRALDAFGNFQDRFTGTVSVAIANNPAGGSILGTSSAAASSGIATFDNVAIDRAGAGYTLRASSGTIGAATSTAFDVTSTPVNPVTHFTVTAAADVVAGTGFIVTVTARNTANQTVTGYNGTVQIGYTGSGDPGPVGSLMNGVGSFTVRIVTAGNQTVTATDAANASIVGSTVVNVAPGDAAHLRFIAQPVSTPFGAVIPPVAVRVEDHFGNTVPNYTTAVNVSLGSNPAGATLGGTTSVVPVSGIATFDSLAPNLVGVGYTLVAASPTLESTISNAFNITDTSGAVAFRFAIASTVEPTNVIVAGVPFNIATKAVNSSGFQAMGYTGLVALEGSAAGALPPSPLAIDSFHTFSNTIIREAGPHTLTIRDVNVPGLTGSINFTVQPAAAHHLVFDTQPTTTDVGVAIAPPITVRVLDEFGNFIADSTATVTLTLGNNPTGAALGGTTTVAAVGGIATFNNVTANRAGENFTLRATSLGLFAAGSAEFDVTGMPGDTPLPNDPNTMLLLHFNSNLIGEAGEQPTGSTGTSFTAGRIAQAVQTGVPGNVRYLETGNILSREGTVEFWIRPDWYGNSGTPRIFFRVGTEGTSGMQMTIDAGNNLRFQQWGDDPATKAREVNVERDLGFSAADWVPGRWHHLAATWNSRTRVMVFYVDGQPVRTRNDAVSIKDFFGDQIAIGGDATGALSSDAAFDEFRISDRARTPTEIGDDYDDGGGDDEPCGAGGRLDINAMVAAGQAVVTGTPFDVGGFAVMFDHDTLISNQTRYRSANINPAVIRVAFATPQTLEGFRAYFSHVAGDPGYRWMVEAADNVADLNSHSGSYAELVGPTETVGDRYSSVTLSSGVTVGIVQLTARRLTGDNFVHIDEFELLAAGVGCPSDTTPPVLANMPADRTVYVTTVADAIVNYPLPTAIDDEDPSPSVVCTPPSGSMFPGGTTTVTCTATDDAGNSSSDSFLVQVFDTQNPTVTSFELVGGTGGATEVIVHFSDILDLAAATNRANFEVRNHGKDLRRGTNDDRVYTLGQPVYDAATRTVRLRAVRSATSPTPITLPANQLIGLRVRDTVLDAGGNQLDGDNNGVAGDDFVASFARGTRVNYFDNDADLVTLTLSGGGVMEFLRREGGEARAINLVNTTLIRSILSGAVARPRPPAQSNGTTTLPPITGSPLRENRLLTNPAFVPNPALAALVDALLEREIENPLQEV
jgi:hypothetical protein